MEILPVACDSSNESWTSVFSTAWRWPRSIQTSGFNTAWQLPRSIQTKCPWTAPCGYVARIICFHFCSCRYNCIVGSCLPLILVLNLVGPAKRFSDNKYIYPISSSFIAVSVYWRGGSGLRTLSRNRQTDSEGFNKQTNGTA